MISTKPPKPKTCAVCKTSFMPARMGAKVCSPFCAMTFARSVNVKAAKIAALKDKSETKQKLDKLKPPSQLEAECRVIVQKIARIRDRFDGCISCHMPVHYDGQWHGSHYRPAWNNAAVQFHLWNIHKSCAQCNLFKGGNLGVYRPRLIAKIGIGRVEWLERQNHVVKTNVPYLIRFKAVMGKRLSRIEKKLKAQL